MLHTNLSTFVKAIHLRYAIPFVLLLVAVYWMGIHPWMRNWGSTAAEQQMVLPGDDLLDHTGKSTWAITINAPADVVWQWLVQIGQDRAGFYSYDWLANLTGADIHSADEIHPEWQHLAVGDGWRTVPADYLWGVGKDALSPVLMIEPGRALVLEMFGAHVLMPIDEGSTRLIVRGESGPSNFLMTMIVDPIVFTMKRRMLLGLKARAEGRPDAPAVLMGIAQIGWIAVGITITALFLIERHRRFWLALAVVASLPALIPATAADKPDWGKREFESNCAVCHGKSGKGDGPYKGFVADNQGGSDLTQLSKRNGGVFPIYKVTQVIDGRQLVKAHGPRDMPIWGTDYLETAKRSAATSETPVDSEAVVTYRIMALAEYVSRLQAK